MVIKKFIGKTEEDATLAAKKELGESIVIMNVRQVNPTGFFAFLKQKQTEIKEVPKPLSWWQQMQLWLGRLVLVALAVLAAWFILKKKTWWLRLLKP